ncbi:MAG: hypothetical protein NTW52_15495 [Planctomycetota bacterium]|nr:hypothetical protein [Planctomycetota bacterium]
MNTSKADLIRKRKRRMQLRLQDSSSIDDGQPVISGGNVRLRTCKQSWWHCLWWHGCHRCIREEESTAR